MVEFGAFLRTQRDRLGLSQAELARRAGVAQSMISDIERKGAVPRVDTWSALMGVLGLAVDPRPMLQGSTSRKRLDEAVALFDDEALDRMARLAEVLDQVPDVMLEGLILMAQKRNDELKSRSVAG